jgi:hypothetical protein
MPGIELTGRDMQIETCMMLRLLATDIAIVD